MTAGAHASLQSGESAEHGRAARRSVPRSAHGDWAPARTVPIPSRARAQAATRLQELVPIRYGRMLVSPFTFYRGAAAVMAADLAVDAELRDRRPGLRRRAHLELRRLRGVDRRMLFGPNDFDETLPGPWEWDVKRMAASVEIAGRDIDLGPYRRRWLVTECVREYREGMRAFANESHLDVWYDRLNASELVEHFGGRLGKKGRILFAKPFQKGRRKTSLRAVEKLTERTGGGLRFRSVPPLLMPLRDRVPLTIGRWSVPDTDLKGFALMSNHRTIVPSGRKDLLLRARPRLGDQRLPKRRHSH